MRLIVGIIWIGLEREGIADFKPIGFGEILMDHRHMLIGCLEMTSVDHAERVRREHIEFRRIVCAYDVGRIAELLFFLRIVIIAAGDLHHAGSHEIGGGVLPDHVRVNTGQLRDSLHISGTNHSASARCQHAALQVTGQHESADRLFLNLSGLMLRCPRNCGCGQHTRRYDGQHNEQHCGAHSLSEHIARRS